MRCHPFERLDTGRYGSNDVRVIQRTNSLHGSLNPSFQKKHLLFPSPFPWSVFSERGNEDKSFLVKGKALRGKEGSWKQPVNSSYPRQILGESFLSSSLLLSYSPFLPLSVSTPPFFSMALLLPLIMLIHRMFSTTLQVYCDFFRGRKEGKHPCSRSILPLWTYMSSIRYLSAHFNTMWRQPPKSTRVNHDLIFLKFFYDIFALFSIYSVRIIRIIIFWKNEYYLIN